MEGRKASQLPLGQVGPLREGDVGRAARRAVGVGDLAREVRPLIRLELSSAHSSVAAWQIQRLRRFAMSGAAFSRPPSLQPDGVLGLGGRIDGPAGLAHDVRLAVRADGVPLPLVLLDEHDVPVEPVRDGLGAPVESLEDDLVGEGLQERRHVPALERRISAGWRGRPPCPAGCREGRMCCPRRRPRRSRAPRTGRGSCTGCCGRRRAGRAAGSSSCSRAGSAPRRIRGSATRCGCSARQLAR